MDGPPAGRERLLAGTYRRIRLARDNPVSGDIELDVDIHRTLEIDIAAIRRRYGFYSRGTPIQCA